MMTEKQMNEISSNIEVIFDSIRKGLLDNIQKIDVTKITEFDFTNDILHLRLPAINKEVSLHQILKLIKDNEKTAIVDKK